MSLNACESSESDANITPMSKRAARPSVGITDEDEANLELLLEAIPFLRSLKRAALLLYLMRVGMDVLADNPLRALEAAPTPETIRPNIEAAKARIRMERERGRSAPPAEPPPSDRLREASEMGRLQKESIEAAAAASSAAARKKRRGSGPHPKPAKD